MKVAASVTVVVDTRLFSIFLGRAAATVTEVYFTLQLGRLIQLLGVLAGMVWVQWYPGPVHADSFVPTDWTIAHGPK